MIYQFDKFTLDTDNFIVTVHGEPVFLEPQAFNLLSYLVANWQRVVSRDELFENLWSGKVICDTTLSGNIKSVRKALGDNGQKQNFIKTIHGRGYQFTQPVSKLENKQIESKEAGYSPLSQANDASSTVQTESTLFTHNTIHEDTIYEGSISQGPLVTVLPFLNLSNDPKEQFFAEGMSDDITTELSRFSDIQVLARHSAFQLKGRSEAADYQCEKRNAHYLVEGKVRRGNDSVRINIQLIDAATNHTVWAEKYDRSSEQVFQLQDEIVETIVSTLSGQIQKIEMVRATNRATKNLRAYDHLLRGLSLHKNGFTSKDNFNCASVEFNKAIELAPNFARARAWRICSDSNMWEVMTEERIEQALKDAKYALSLDSSESEIHRILAAIYLWARNYKLSGYHYNEARKLSPNDAHIAVKMGRYLAFIDQNEEALKLVRHAMYLNPLHPGWYFQELGVVYYSMNKFEAAITAFERNWELSAYDLAFIAACQIANGEILDARKSCAKALALEPNSSVKLFTQFETYQDLNKSKLLSERMLKAGFPA